MLSANRHIDKTGKEPVAMFHSHRRQPANFSSIDFRLHNPMYPWHLIISLRDPARPGLQPFRVRKDLADYGISEHDCHQNSEQDYMGPEVTPMILRIRDQRLKYLAGNLFDGYAPQDEFVCTGHANGLHFQKGLPA